MKKYLAIAVILLFIGLAFAPSINANVSKDMVEITTEVCGLDGGKQTVKLTQDEAEEVDALYKSIRERLNATETRNEAEEIFREAVVELDKYGLLGGLSVKQAQRLVTWPHRKTILAKLFNRFLKSNSGSSEEYHSNAFCFVSTVVESSWCISFSTFPWFLFIAWLERNNIPGILGFFLYGLYYIYFPIRFLSIVINPDSIAEILFCISIGLEGVKKGGDWVEIVGFRGFKFSKVDWDFDPFFSFDYEVSWYFGRAMHIGDDILPW